MDSAALGTAMNEIQRLKNQLQIVAESEATQINHAESAHEELQRLRMELNETLSLVERMKSEMNDCRQSEAEAMEAAREAQQQLEAIALELEQSKAQAKSLEASGDSSATAMEVTVDQDATNQLKGEVKSLKYEVGQLKAALEASEARYQVEYIQSTLEIRSAYEQAEKTKQESVERETELEAELGKMEEENQSSEKESELAMHLKKLEHDFTLLKAALLEKETQVKGLAEKNDMLKIEIERGEAERSRANDEAAAIADTAKAGEREALMKLGSVTEEADKSSRRVARVTEQLDAAQAANTEMEAELRRLKVQADQWRKAAEAAASMLSSTGNNNNGKFVERTGSLDNGMNNYNTIAGTMGSPFSEDMDDESPKKKNGNVLKKFGVLWKKGQK
ncbi:unnamed protein product [Linum tenue]|nr:unnamed protein product [Linum tenue]